jgi:hypothetical protein
MTPRKKDITEIRRLGMRLLKLACSPTPSPDDLRHANGDFQRLAELTAQVSTARLNDFYQQELDFGMETLADPKIKKICSLKSKDRSVWTISVPFESNRRRH